MGRRDDEAHGGEAERCAVDRAVANLATAQHGVVAVGQLRSLGLGRQRTQHRVTAGRLHPMHRGVYAVGHRALTEQGRWMAAVLACGPGAHLSHLSAAALWGVRPTSQTAVDVTVPCPRRGRAGIVLRQAGRPHAEDVTRRQGIPVASIPRMLLDLAALLPARELRRVWEEADRQGLVDIDAIARLCARTRVRAGVRTLRRLLRTYAPAPAVRSELERRFLELCRDAGLPAPAVNAQVAGLEVDMSWPAAGLMVELDGYAFHRHRGAFERDRARDAALALAGFRVVRMTHRRLEAEPSEVVRTVRALLDAQPA